MLKATTAQPRELRLLHLAMKVDARPFTVYGVASEHFSSRDGDERRGFDQIG
jgi:hypothetical protein